MVETKGATVLITDAGGRGSVMAKAYASSPHVEKVLVVPGNDMVGELSDKPIIPVKGVSTSNLKQIEKILKDEKVTLIDVAQDEAVKVGIADMSRSLGIATVGPNSSPGMLEWDKAYGRQIAKLKGINQPNYKVFADENVARKYIARRGPGPVFIKAGGLARGKGVKLANNLREAYYAIYKLKRDHPEAMREFLVEEPITGEELSNFYAISGDNYKRLGEAQDYKREYDGDKGENTGGMGAVSRPLIAKDANLWEGTEEIIKKTMEAQKEAEDPYEGIIFLGLMSTPDGLSLIEYNARWGDPEAQVIIPSIENDFFELNMAIANGTLGDIELRRDEIVRVSVTVAAQDYPRSYERVRGKEVKSMRELKKLEDIEIYGAGVAIEDDKYFINGGRVFHLTAAGNDVIEARSKLEEPLDMIRRIDGDILRARRDIGLKDVARLKNSV